MTGHLRATCFRIHGYSQWHRLFGEPKPKPKLTYSKGSIVASLVLPTESTSSGGKLTSGKGVTVGTNTSQSDNLNLTDGQCKQLIQLLQKSISGGTFNGGSTPELSQLNQFSNIVPSSSSGSISSWFPQHTANIMHMTGKHVVHQVHNVSTDFNQSKWIIDTGATYHITPYLHLLQNIHSCEATLQLPNGAVASVSYTGNIILNDAITLTNVLCVPEFNYNLLSISKLLHDTNCQVNFMSDICYLQSHSWKTKLVLGKEENGIYVLTDDSLLAKANTVSNSSQLQDSFIAQVASLDL